VKSASLSPTSTRGFAATHDTPAGVHRDHSRPPHRDVQRVLPRYPPPRPGCDVNRAELEAWVLQLSREAFAVNTAATCEVVQALSGGHEVFCPQAYTSERLHRAGAAFLRIARL
jgi:hypothetical protein